MEHSQTDGARLGKLIKVAKKISGARTLLELNEIFEQRLGETPQGRRLLNSKELLMRDITYVRTALRSMVKAPK